MLAKLQNLSNIYSKNSANNYYFVSLIVVQLLLAVQDRHQNDKNLADRSLTFSYYFVVALSVSSPLVLEYLTDALLSCSNAEYNKALKKHRFADALVIVSLTASGIIKFCGNEESLSYFTIAASYGQVLLLCGLYGRLLILDDAKWNGWKCTLLLLLFLVSQLLLCKSNSNSSCVEAEYCESSLLLKLSTTFCWACFLLHLYFCQRYFSQINHITQPHSTSDTVGYHMAKFYPCIIGMSIIAIYLFATSMYLLIAAAAYGNGTYLLRCNLFTLIITVVVAATVPGRLRIFRKILLKVTFQCLTLLCMVFNHTAGNNNYNVILFRIK